MDEGDAEIIVMNINKAEQLLFSTFTDVPFHSLYFHYNKRPGSLDNGGTCSDKVLHAFELFKRNGFDVHLHSSFIDDVECHKMLRLEIEGLSYFADVGNAWPAVKLFPADEEIRYVSCGILFYTKLSGERIDIYQDIDGEIVNTVSIPRKSKSEREIEDDIKNRFSGTFPFSGHIFFAQIVGDKFLFLRDAQLYIYSDCDSQIVSGITPEKIPDCLKSNFNFSVDEFLRNSHS